MALFAISDLHLSLGTNKPMDIFDGWKDYVKKIKINWEKIVTDEDTVVVNGDISWALKLKDAYNDMRFINSLPGQKIFIKGNHDLWWGTKSKVERFFSENGFTSLKLLFNNSYTVDDVAICGSKGWFLDIKAHEDKKILKRELGRVETSLKCAVKSGKEPIVFLHYPPIYGNFVCEPMIKLLQKYSVKKCYYGHIHGKRKMAKAVIDELYGIKFNLISCDYTRFRPIIIL